MIFLLSSFQHFIRLRNITYPKTGFYSWKIKLLTQITYGINSAFAFISIAIFYCNKKLKEKNPEENKDDGHIFAKTALNKVSQTLLRFVVIFWNLHHQERSFCLKWQERPFSKHLLQFMVSFRTYLLNHVKWYKLY